MTTPAAKTNYSIPPPLSEEARRKIRRADPAMTVSASFSPALAPPGVPVVRVEPGSLAEEGGIHAGMKLLRINGEAVRDTIDLFFHGADETVVLEFETSDGDELVVEIEKDYPEEDLGLELQQFTTQHCGCNCVFCFVHQLPDNMRKSLYVKDEDYRLSFLQGSYITGATLKEPDLDRMARQRLTPLYLSVHAIDEELRRWLLGIRRAMPILDILGFFREHRIQVHTQVVLCPGHNDGVELERTLEALLGFHPTVQSVAIVPVGMTKWREGLPDLRPVTPEYARRFLREMAPRLKAVEREFGEPLVLLADEWSLIAGRRPPAYSAYPDMPQLENGVGMVYHFYRDLAAARRLLAQTPLGRTWRVAAFTSTLSAPVLDRIVAACAVNGEIEVTPIPVVNTVFGESIHVTGLLCGKDLAAAIDANPGYDQYLLPGNCLRRYDERFLDDVTLADLRARTSSPVNPVLGGALDFAETILEAAGRRRHEPVSNHPFLAPHWSNA